MKSKSKRNSNPVAKHAKNYNKAIIFKDRKKAFKKGEYKYKAINLQSDSIAA